MNLIFYQSDHRQVELAHLERVEEDIARRYGRLPGTYTDSVDLFQAVKDRAFKTKDKRSLSDLRELDRLLKLRLEIKTGALPNVVSVHFLMSSIVLFIKSHSTHIASTSRGFGRFFAISVRAAASNTSSATQPSCPSSYYTSRQGSIM